MRSTPKKISERFCFLTAILAWVICRFMIIPLGWLEMTNTRYPLWSWPFFEPIPAAVWNLPYVRFFLFTVIPLTFLMESLALHFFQHGFIKRLQWNHRLTLAPISLFGLRILLFYPLASLVTESLRPLWIFAFITIGVVIWAALIARHFEARHLPNWS